MYDHLLLRCSTYGADSPRLDLGASLDELIRLAADAELLLRVTLRRLELRKIAVVWQAFGGDDGILIKGPLTRLRLLRLGTTVA